MAFMHKLSCRIALIRDALLLASPFILLVSCYGDTAGPKAPDPVPSVPVAAVAVNPVYTAAMVGLTVPLTPTIQDSTGAVLTGRVVTWATSNPDVATVSDSGVVTGVGVGSATITATAERRSGKADVIVMPPSSSRPPSVAAVAVNPVYTSTMVGLTISLTPTMRDSTGAVLTGRVVTWTTSDIGIARVSENGVVTGVNPGSATITAKSEGESGTAVVLVTPLPPSGPAPVAAVAVNPVYTSAVVGLTIPLTPTIQDSTGDVLTGRTVTWATSDAGVAKVSDNGVVTGVGVGSATITATAEGKSARAMVTVTPPPPPPPGLAWPNEPAGLSVINDQSWDCLICNGWNYHPEDGYADIQYDPTAPISPSDVLRVVFPTTLPEDHQPAINSLWLGGPRTELYGAYWMKLSSNWDRRGMKLNMMWAGNDMVYLHLSDEPTPKIGVVVLWSPYGYDNAPADHLHGGAWPSNVATTPILKGQWYLVETYMKYPTTPGGNDGIIRWWVNGMMQGNYENVQYPADDGFIQYDYPFTRQVAPAEEQYVYIDHTHVSAR